MQIIRFAAGQEPEWVNEETAENNTQGFFWVDIERTELDWHDRTGTWLGVYLHDRHIQDTLNETHPPYYDGTEEYDLLVMRSLDPASSPVAPATHPIALVITERAVISIRPKGDPVFEKLQQRFMGAPRKSPASPAMLLYLLLDQITNTLLARRDVTTELISHWQDCLLERCGQFSDWQSLMRLQSQLRRLEVVAEGQLDAMLEWRTQTDHEFDASLAVRFNDLQEHLRRVYLHAAEVQHDIEGLVQIYFSANTQRTNEILQFLTIISAVFLPLNLIAGIFGMNFVHMPMLQQGYSPWLIFGLMLLIPVGLMAWFRKRRWM